MGVGCDWTIGPRDTTQNFVFDEGKLSIRVLHTGSRGFYTVKCCGLQLYDMIENIDFPSFLINSPEVKMTVHIYSLEMFEIPWYHARNAPKTSRYHDLQGPFGGIFDQRVTSDGLQYFVHTWSSDTTYLIQTNFPQNPVNNHCE